MSNYVSNFLLVVCLTGVIPAASGANVQPDKTEPKSSAAVKPDAKDAPKSSALAKAEQKPGTKAGKKVPSKQRSKAQARLVPPPPPDMPFVMMGGATPGRDSLLSGVVLDYLSLADLDRLKGRAQTALDKAKQAAGEREQERLERIKRAETFEQLYKEGVVSRKELETARRERTDIDGDLSEGQNKINDLTEDLRRITEQEKRRQKKH